MTIYQKSSGGTFYYDFYVNGQRYHGSTHEKQRGRAETYAAIKRSEATEKRMPPGMRKTPLLSAYAKQFLEDVESKKQAGHLAHNSARYYVYGVELLKGTSLWSLRLDRIDSSAVEKVSFSSASVGNTALRTLRHLLHVAEDARLIYRAPKFKLFEDRERTSIIEPWLEEIMLAEAKEPLRTVMIIMLDSFMRPAEVVAMKWEDISWERMQIWIPKSKSLTGRRHVGLTQRTSLALQSIRRATVSDSTWVFPQKPLISKSSNGPEIPPQLRSHMWATSLCKMWGKMKAGILKAHPEIQWPKDLVLYSCRHTGATAYSDAVGQNQFKVKQALGHADLKTTGRYIHPAQDQGAVMDNVVQMRKKRA